MKIINNDTAGRGRREVITSRNIYLGIMLIAAGVIWLLCNFDVLGDDIFDVIFSWQMMLIVVGGYLISLRRWVSGAIVAAVGVLFSLTEHFGLELSLTKIVLPVVVIAAGIGLLVQRRPH